MMKPTHVASSEVNASDLFPVNDDSRFPERPGRAARWRWIHRGVTAPDGQNVKLHAVRVGRIWYTCAAWWQEFVSACNSQQVEPTPMPRSPATRAKATAAAEAELIARGA